MKHAREDYNRIQDPALQDPSLLSPGSTPIEDDEPVFLLRAQDGNAPATVGFWASIAERNGADIEIVNRVLEQAQKMEQWKDRKIPDYKPGQSDHPFERKPIEQRLFTWEEWDGDVQLIQFYDCTLLRPIGNHSIGEKIDTIVLNYIDGIMEFYRSSDEAPYEKYRILLTVLPLEE